jgi:acetolactate synthase-1/3 small subunit
MKNFIVSMLVNNETGVLARVVMMFRRRNFNIDTLTVSETEEPKFSRITISFTGDEAFKKQLISQLRKIADVKFVKVLDGRESLVRELTLVKLKNQKDTRQDIMTAADVYGAKIIDYGPDSITVEITGETSKVNNFIELVKDFGIIELCRTGVVALERGKNSIVDQVERRD